MIIAVLALLVMLGAAALTIDYGMCAMTKQKLQDVVDLSALAGCDALQYGNDQTAARAAVHQASESNVVLGAPLHIADADIQIGAWNAATKTVIPWTPTCTQGVVQVIGRRTTGSTDGPVPLFFAKALGTSTSQMTARAAASVGISLNPRRPVEITVVQDSSGSFLQEYPQAITADFGLYNLVNKVSITGDSLSFVAFDDDLTMSDQYTYVYQNWHYVKVYTPLNKAMTTFGSSRSSLPSDWNTFQTLCNNHTAAGWTNPAAALDWVQSNYASLGNRTAHQQSIVLVSDGMPYASTTSETNARRAACTADCNALAALGVRIYTVTLTRETSNTDYGASGADYTYMASLVRNGGVAFISADINALAACLVAVGTLEVGHPSLIQ